MADVRNGRGFAGVKTGEGFNPISDPRGVPKDANPYYLGQVKGWGDDGHSHSYHTLKQLKDYDWTQETVQYGVVNEANYKEFKEGRKDFWYSGGVFGNNVVMISNEEMDALIAGDMAREEDKAYYTQAKWGVSYSDAAGSFYTKSIPALERLSEDGIGEDVRIVFFFDN